MNYRIEKDTMGEVQVPADKYWGAKTEPRATILKSGPRPACQRKLFTLLAI